MSEQAPRFLWAAKCASCNYAAHPFKCASVFQNIFRSKESVHEKLGKPCGVCGKLELFQFVDSQKPLCGDCLRAAPDGFRKPSRVHFAAYHSQSFGSLKKRWKEGKKWPVPPLAYLFISWWVAETFHKNQLYDTIVPVPWSTGEDSGMRAVLTRAIGRGPKLFEGITFPYRAIQRAGQEISKGKSAEEKWEIAKKEYSAGPDIRSVAGRRVLIADDVLTTGATIQRITHILHEAGAQDIGAFAFSNVMFEDKRDQVPHEDPLDCEFYVKRAGLR